METIGFIGLGVMGRPMATNLLRAGRPVTVYNRSPAAVDTLVEDGAELAASVQDIAQGSDVLITMLPDSPDVDAVVLGSGGVAENMRRGGLFIDMSTISPATARAVHSRMTDRGIEAVDAPVSGGEPAARSATLSVMVGGSERAFARALPILNDLGQNVVHIGGPGAGQVAKAANQVVVALTIMAISEGLSLAHASGVDVSRVREALLRGFAHSRVLENHGARMLSSEFDPGFRLRLHRKDLTIALQSAREVGVPLLATAQAAEVMNALIGAGHGDADHAVISKFYGDLSEGTRL